MRALRILLLVCFTLVLTPKQWWHHCNHTTHHKSDYANTDTIDEDCPVCDLSLSVYTHPVISVFHFRKQVPAIHKCAKPNSYNRYFYSLFQLRAPPVSMF